MCHSIGVEVQTDHLQQLPLFGFLKVCVSTNLLCLCASLWVIAKGSSVDFIRTVQITSVDTYTSKMYSLHEGYFQLRILGGTGSIQEFLLEFLQNLSADPFWFYHYRSRLPVFFGYPLSWDYRISSLRCRPAVILKTVASKLLTSVICFIFSLELLLARKGCQLGQQQECCALVADIVVWALVDAFRCWNLLRELLVLGTQHLGYPFQEVWTGLKVHSCIYWLWSSCFFLSLYCSCRRLLQAVYRSKVQIRFCFFPSATQGVTKPCLSAYSLNFCLLELASRSDFLRMSGLKECVSFSPDIFCLVIRCLQRLLSSFLIFLTSSALNDYWVCQIPREIQIRLHNFSVVTVLHLEYSILVILADITLVVPSFLLLRSMLNSFPKTVRANTGVNSWMSALNWSNSSFIVLATNLTVLLLILGCGVYFYSLWCPRTSSPLLFLSTSLCKIYETFSTRKSLLDWSQVKGAKEFWNYSLPLDFDFDLDSLSWKDWTM